MKKGVNFRLAAGFFLFLILDIVLLACRLCKIALLAKAFAAIMAAAGVLSVSGAFFLSRNYDSDDNYDTHFLVIDMFLGGAFIKLFLEAAALLR